MTGLLTHTSHVGRLRKFFILYLPLFGILIGMYIMVTALSPYAAQLPVVGDAARQSVMHKLQASAGTYGDRLYIPQIGVDVAIVTGTTEQVLEKGAWHRKPENGDPEHGGNFILSAHRFQMGWTPQRTAVLSPFYNINHLKLGDLLQVDYKSKRYTYKISRIFKVSPGQTDIEAPSQTAKLTLYSCTLRGSADGRDVIEAVTVATP